MSKPLNTLPTAEALAANWPPWPTYGTVDDTLPTLERWAVAGHRVALATLVNIVGSSPRPLGSEMAICDTGEVVGYVSGGCVEGAVAAEAMNAMQTGAPRLLDYGAGSPVLDVQLTCGGRIAIFVRELADPVDHARRLRDARARRAPLTLYVDLKTGAQRYAPTPAQAAPAAGHIFVQTFLPPTRVMLVGNNPVALALCEIAPALGFEIGLLRPYGPEALPAGLKVDFYDRRALDKAVADMPIDAWTAVYAVTHHAEDDQTVLIRALPSPAFSVGVLGSKRKVQQRLHALSAAQLPSAAIKRLHAPAGLDIHARGPHEIALSILAEIIATQPRASCTAPADLAGLTTSGDGHYPAALASCPV
ncbi:MAG: XdhC family protein [Nevskiaceae bacterium]|nr:MAG: XdhC family protein [Nevskiaceae bacterium]TBR74257.1 MAG: XdhC family protein [Nevskiaceae bacterium]